MELHSFTCIFDPPAYVLWLVIMLYVLYSYNYNNLEALIRLAMI